MAYGGGGSKDQAATGFTDQCQIAVLHAELAREPLDGAFGGLVAGTRCGILIVEMRIVCRARLEENALEWHTWHFLKEPAFLGGFTPLRDNTTRAHARSMLAEVDKLRIIFIESGRVDDFGRRRIGEGR